MVAWREMACWDMARWDMAHYDLGRAGSGPVGLRDGFDLGPPVEPQRVHLPGTGPILEPGSALEREHRRLVASFGGEYRAPKVQAQLNAISERLRLVSDRPSEQYRVIVLNAGTVNAFALPNGYVYITRGLLALANDSAEIASVVAHEIAHVTARHAMARAELESRSALVSRVMTEVLDNPGAGQLMRDQSRVAFASFATAGNRCG